MADTTLPPLVDDLRCAPQAVELGLDPRGTATRCQTVVLIEYHGLWPAKIEEIDLIAGLPDLPAGHRILTTRGADAQAMPSLTVWRAGQDLRFTGTDYEAEPERLGDALTSAIAALADGGEPNEADGVMTIGAAPPEVLICGHGRRDTCCGNFGVRLLAQAEQRAAEAWPGVRVRRCSHTGGHRFAPTGITLPEGRMWAFLDLDLLDAAVTGRAEPALADASRGLMALEPLAQRAEAALWSEHGPAWRSADLSVEETGIEGAGIGGTAVGGAAIGGTATSDAGDGARHFRFAWNGSAGSMAAGQATVTVRRSGAVAVPSCGSPLEEASKTSPTYEIVGIDAG